MPSENAKSHSHGRQGEKFRDAAREAETDDREETFDRALKRIAVTPPPPKDKKPKADK